MTLSHPVTGRGQVHVLIVEDDAGDALLTSELLDASDGSFAATTASNLAEAVALLAGRPFACVLLDLGLPDAVGREALEGVLAAAPQAAVIVLTGHDDRDAAVAAVSAGAQDYLAKGSVDGDVLARAVRYAIERKRSDETARALFARELSAAESARLERGLLPRLLLNDPALDSAARYRSGGGAILLGGDFFDAIELDDGSVRVVIGDVAGHSADEAATGVALRIAWRGLVLAGLEETATLPALEAVLEAERPHENLFTTVLDVTIRPDRRSMTARSAGHPPPIVADPEPHLVELGHVGPPLGTFSPGQWVDNAIDLAPGWTALFFTDGLVEGRTAADRTQRWGHDGLLAALRRALHPGNRLGDVADALLAAAEAENGGPVPDDIAILLLSESQ